MRRKLYSGVLLLLLGSMTALSVCWSISLRSRIQTLDSSAYPHSAEVLWSRADPELDKWTHLFVHDAAGATFIESLAVTSARAMSQSVNDDLVAATPPWARRFAWPWLDGQAAWPPTGGVDWRVAIAFGWPLKGMWVGYQPGAQVFASLPTTVGGIDWKRPSTGRSSDLTRALPCRILWLGFLGDAVIYAAAWAVLTTATRRATLAVRANLRRRRNLCPHCAYDLRGTPTGTPCPECGRAAARSDTPA